MPAPPLVRRRTAVMGLAATVLVAGCDHGDDVGAPATTGSPGATSTTSAGAPAHTPDEALVDEVLAELDGALGLLAVAHRAAALRTAVAPLLKAHRRHVEVLGGDPSPTGAAATGRPATLHAVQRSESRLQGRLVDAAGKAESGALAKLLASISASVTQHLDTLPKNA